MKGLLIFRGATLILASGYVLGAWGQEKKLERPNFVWFMAEDVSKHYLQLYNANKIGAQTPNVTKLANEGIVFENAYSNAPVSSAARSTLITGCYAPRLGASFHRKLEQVPMPENLSMFPAYLRKVGYHTSNAAKTDYNCFIDMTAWDIVNGKAGDWRKRKDKSQPFFHVRTSGTTHEGNLHFPLTDVSQIATRTKLSDVAIHPFHPDTELFRYTYATFYDCIQRSDQELGKLVEMLRVDGELDNTFIFYFGDNGGSLPGTKGYTNELGLQVPLVVYVPKKWQDLLPVKAGQRADGFVSFIDFGPTLLHLAGLEVPEEMDGKPFLGTDISLEQLNKRDEVYGYGDRFDELYAFNRTLRKGQFKYSRNYQPYHPKSLHAVYRYKQLAFREWGALYEDGKLNEAQSAFFRPQGAEELYDLSIDPFETHNLASDPAYRGKLHELRKILTDKLIVECDLGFYPECEWLSRGHGNPTTFGKMHETDIAAYIGLVDLQLQPFAQVKRQLKEALLSADAVKRYWAATVCASFGKEAKPLKGILHKMLADKEAYVASRALVALNFFSTPDNYDIAVQLLKRASCDAELLLALNDMGYLHWKTGEVYPFQSEDFPKACESVQWRLLYINGTEKNIALIP